MQHLPRILTVAAVIGTLFAGPAALAAAPRAENAYLSQADAMARAARVSNVAYDLSFELTGKETFSATSHISFDLKDTDQPLTIDLNKGTITALTVNGKPVTPQYNNWFITVAPKDLVAGRNTVSVSYTRLHSTNGEGLHRNVDAADGRVYTYSHFEPAAASQMFALFDQPNIKATYATTVVAPSDWTVVSTTRETKIEDLGATRRWTFPASKQLSSYNFSLHAGPYKVWEDGSGKYPMRLFARQSVASQVNPADWFRYTKNGLVFFDQYFGIPYQFEKYDQLIVPDFLYGAMENAAAVTFAERGFVQKGATTAAQRESLAEVILHEMAHQWFGDLVTMDWWNGLWLNESFASFMATHALHESTEFKHAWRSFYINDKQAGYHQDQSPATHPIEVPVPSSANAFDNIDAITYSKGASTLKQLRHLLGDEVFRKGVHNYLVKYQYQNAKLEDFIGTLGKTAGRDLGPWTEQWLYQAGVNTLTANYRCEGGKVASFTLDQGVARPGLDTLREQRVQVAAFTMRGKNMKLTRNIPVIYKGASTAVPGMVGAACPDLVYPNYQDWGFVKVQLDGRSFATAGKHLGTVRDPLLRAMLWQSLWDGVRDGKYPLNAFLQTVIDNAGSEHDYVLLGDVLNKTSAGVNLLRAANADPAYVATTLASLQTMSWTGVQANRSKPDFARRWLGLYEQVASDKRGLDKLASVLSGATVIPGVPLDQDLRWDLIRTLNRFDHPGSAALIDAELARDKSDAGQTEALAARVVRPDAAVKGEWLAAIDDTSTKVPFPRLRTAMGYLYMPEQQALSEASAAARLARLPAIDKAAGPVFMRSYAQTMIPLGCSEHSVARLDKAIAEYRDLSAFTARSLREKREDDMRCVTIKNSLTLR
ncbi:aminopeptidase N [Massilia sp. PAMC28688]|uniref:aminopeptidase N n=1 Tax=Massilia sp. PAMC28688 TaxID=2861283 RepID=UPI001C62B5A7|nr:aminopeptidase N [Massilia sp. PAMC28688]QYF92548.1 aminopeptidase N [Massilia sp. PAMC28688]